jgi:molecular chaperone GrpE (heat shock protein)
MTLHEENAVLRAQVAELREQVRALLAEVEDLKGRLSKDSQGLFNPRQGRAVER